MQIRRSEFVKLFSPAVKWEDPPENGLENYQGRPPKYWAFPPLAVFSLPLASHIGGQ